MLTQEAIKALASSMLAILTQQDEQHGSVDVEHPYNEKKLTAKQQAAVNLALRVDNKAGVAKKLGIPRSTLYRWIDKAERA